MLMSKAKALPQQEGQGQKASSCVKGGILCGKEMEQHPGARDFFHIATKAGITIDVVREPNDGYWSNVWLKKPFCAVFWGGRPTEDMMFSTAYAAGQRNGCCPEEPIENTNFFNVYEESNAAADAPLLTLTLSALPLCPRQGRPVPGQRRWLGPAGTRVSWRQHAALVLIQMPSQVTPVRHHFLQAPPPVARPSWPGRRLARPTPHRSPPRRLRGYRMGAAAPLRQAPDR